MSKISVSKLYTVLENDPESWVIGESPPDDRINLLNNENFNRLNNQGDSLEISLAEQYVKCRSELRVALMQISRFKHYRDIQMKQIVSKLMLLEGTLIRERRSMSATLAQKDEKILELEKKLSIFAQQLNEESEYADSAIGSLEILPSGASTPALSGRSIQPKRSHTDPDKSSVEGALNKNKCRRANTDPSKYHTRNREHTLCHKYCQTMVQEFRSIETQTECQERVTPLVKERSYSNPADVEAEYDKTRSVSSCSQSSQDATDGMQPPPLPPRLRSRKRSVSTPDIRLLVPTCSNPPIPRRRRKSSNYLRPLETSCDTAEFLLPEAPPTVTQRPERPTSLRATNSSSRNSVDASTIKLSPKLVRKTAVVLRSYSTSVDSDREDNSNTTRKSSDQTHDPTGLKTSAPWLSSPDEEKSSDDLINTAAKSFLSEKPIYF